MSNFQDYLRKNKKLNAPQDEKDALFKQYRKEYHKNYNAKRLKQNKLIQLFVDLPSYKVLSEDANELGLKVSEFVRLLIKTYKDNSYILPDETVLHELIVSLTRIGTNLNQIAYLCNKKKQVGYKEIEEVKIIFEQISSKVLEHFKPLHIEDYIKKEAERNPYFIEVLLRIIEDYKKMGL